MTANLKTLADYAWMSQASYLDFTGLGAGDSELFKAMLKNNPYDQNSILAVEQANTFTDPATGYSFINHRPNTPTGFSATVFFSNAGAGYMIAVRGTEPGNFITDLFRADGLGVVLTGQAVEQLIDAYRYYKQLTSTGASNIYSAAEIAELKQLYVQTPAGILAGPGLEGQILLFENTLRQDVGLNLIPAGSTINFTGHSLGGHVAALLAEMVAQFDGVGRIGDVVTYNAPGFDALVYELGNLLGIPTTVQTGILGAKHLAIIGEGGLEVTAGLGQVNGTKQFTFIEKAALNISLDNHSIVKLGDSFAIKAVLSKLDPSQSIAQLDTILKSASNKFPDSLERALDALRRTFGFTTATPSDDRNALYANLAALQADPKFIALAGQVKIVASPTSISQARTDFGAFLSLVYLTPFALKAVGASIEATLKSANSTLGSQWDADNALTADQIKDGQASYSDLWLADRAAMLTWLNKTYTEDTDVGRVYDGSAWHFKDEASGKEVWVGNPYDVKSNPLLRKVLFGQTGADILTGGGSADHLYGGLGYDVLSGGDGGDYIEGNDGNDTLNGEAGRDTLLGGAGDDTLDGGLGNDRLEGGLGIDTYKYAAGGGFDVIRDIDGQGAILLDAVALTGGNRRSDNVWQSGDIVYNFSADTSGRGNLRISRGAGTTLLVENFQSGELGINLPGAITSPTLPPASAQPVPVPSSGYVTEFNDLFGDGIVYLGQQSGELGDDLFIGSNNWGDSMFGDVGDDWLEGNAGGDLLIGGEPPGYIPGSYSYNLWQSDPSDNDVLIGGTAGGHNWTAWEFDTVTGISYETGDMLLDNGGGNDWLIAGELADLDKIKAGLLGQIDPFADWLAAGNGDDVLVGSNNGDALFGGGDKDIIYGGAGDDTIHGDDFYTMASIFWNVLNTDNPFDWQYQAYSKRYPSDPNYNILGVPTIYKDVGNDDILYGGLGNDRIIGQLGKDQLYGEAGDDILAGWEGDDWLFGGAGNDKLTGGALYNDERTIGNDLLDGGADELIGGNKIEAEKRLAPFAARARRLECQQLRRRQFQRRGQAADIHQRDITLPTFHAAQIAARHARFQGQRLL